MKYSLSGAAFKHLGYRTFPDRIHGNGFQSFMKIPAEEQVKNKRRKKNRSYLFEDGDLLPSGLRRLADVSFQLLRHSAHAACKKYQF